MASLGLHVLTLILGSLFIFMGHIKITPQFFPEQHTYIKNEFGKFNKEFPFHRQTGWRPYAKNYRLAIGITEVACGFLLVLGFFSTLANLILLMVMINAIITFQKLNYPMEYIGVLICISFLLLLRLVLASRSKVKQSIKSTTTKVEKTS
ncbi:unnamed protein product [Rotaria sp. Silwood1]|nr:unnamed protein product [Rotaria sp. Silwood1]CAF1470503.1 unnamed protein product [Rotaria sp. Silwood1]CAF3476443.1 unnamed protein product [Rotaria sp. Silwood1]CAF3528234.1 unnamed protein product [Rotaria sp. Silwood1]CAF3643250.1 unnamed protein product [Rotaria sp. Silwood1]